MLESDHLDEVHRIAEQYTEIHDEIQRVWREHVAYTWHWWVDLSLAVLPWILWLIIRDKKNTHRLLYAGMFTAFIATVLDMAGVSQGGWIYNTWVLPYFPGYLPWDWTIMPVTAMLFYQFFPKVNPWLKGLIFSAFASYVAEPVFIWLGFYEPFAWEHYYSLPLYFAIFMAGYWLYTRRFPPIELDRKDMARH